MTACDAQEEGSIVPGHKPQTIQPATHRLDLDLGIPFDGTPFFKEKIYEHHEIAAGELIEMPLPRATRNSPEDSFDLSHLEITTAADLDSLPSVNEFLKSAPEASKENLTETTFFSQELDLEESSLKRNEAGKVDEIDRRRLIPEMSHGLTTTKLSYMDNAPCYADFRGTLQGKDTELSRRTSTDQGGLEESPNCEGIYLDKSHKYTDSTILATKMAYVSFPTEASSIVVTMHDGILKDSRSEALLGHKLNSFESQTLSKEDSAPELFTTESFNDHTVIIDQYGPAGSKVTPILTPSQNPLSSSLHPPLMPPEKDMARRAQQNQDAISYISSLGVRIGNNIYLERDCSTISSIETASDMQDTQTILTSSSSSTPTTATSATTSPTRSVSETLDSQKPQPSLNEHDSGRDLTSKAAIDKSLAAVQDIYLSEAKARPRTTSRLPHVASFSRLTKGHSERVLVGKALAHTASEGNAVRLAELSREYPKLLDMRTSSGQQDRPKTALMRAAIIGHITCMEVLKQNGANIFTVDERKRTALHLAVAAHQTSSVRWLIGPHTESGPIVTRNGVMDLKEASDIQGSRPLHIAAKRNHRDIAGILIAAGASSEAVDNMGRTPLHSAVINGHLDMCTFLLSKVGYINALDADQMTPLHWAVKSNRLDIIDYLLAESAEHVNNYDRHGYLAIHYAVEQGQLEAVERFNTVPEDLERRTKSGETPLHLACSKNHLLVVKALLRHGVEVNPWTTVTSPKPSSRSVFSKSARREGLESSHVLPSTPLHYSCLAGNYDCADQLLKSGAWVNAPQEDGRTPLMLSVESGNHQLVSLLLESGAQPNAATSSLCLTALHISCRKANLELTKLLIQRGANVWACTSGAPALTPSEYMDKAPEKEINLNQKKAVHDYLHSQTIHQLCYKAGSARINLPPSQSTSDLGHGPSYGQGPVEISQMLAPESMGISLGPSPASRFSSPTDKF